VLQGQYIPQKPCTNILINSTVSKVLRQKDKYLSSNDGSRSPIRRPRSKPDLEKALSVWAKNHVKTGQVLTDDALHERAKFFMKALPNGEGIQSGPNWLEKFKNKHNLGASKVKKLKLTKSRDALRASAKEKASLPTSSDGFVVPQSPVTATPMSASHSQNSFKQQGSPESYGDAHAYPSNSQSTASLSGSFTDTAASSFSAGPTSPASSFSPDSHPMHSPFLPPGHHSQRFGSFGMSHPQSRPRSQTFPMLTPDQSSYLPVGLESHTAKFVSTSPPQGGMTPIMPQQHQHQQQNHHHHHPQDPLGIDQSIHSSFGSMSSGSTVLQPPPQGIDSSPRLRQQFSSPNGSFHSSFDRTGVPSFEDAQQALELVQMFMQSQFLNGGSDEEVSLLQLKCESLSRLPPPRLSHSISLGQIPEVNLHG
jgi:hypothetical protein